jgi:methylenetetrahydrofolate dehydrogenase (NADP+)/methenyltetrahydrofolate cyclohydrolase
VPGLAVILVGADPASRVYVRNKRKAVLRVGFRAHDCDLPADTTQAELLRAGRRASTPTRRCTASSVQLPLPAARSTRTS